MQPLNFFHDYSDFFKSGFRAFTNRGRRQSETASHADTPSLTPKTTFSDTTKRRPRPVSMHNTPREKTRQRRSSFPSFSSHFSSRRNSTSSADSGDSGIWTNFLNETSTIFSRRSSTSSADSGDSEFWTANTNFLNETSIFSRRSNTSSTGLDDSEVWIAGGGMYTLPAINGSSDEISCDPFSSASDARSIFLDFPSSKRSSIILSRRE